MYFALTVIPLALLVFALVDAIITDDSRVKHLPKFGWIILIVLLPLAGSIAWLIAGKDRGLSGAQHGTFGDPRRHQQAVERMRTEAEELAEIDREIERMEREARIRHLEEQIAERKREKN